MPLVSSKAPPKGYLTVREALESPLSTRFNIIGVVMEFFEPTKSQGADMMLTFRIGDKSACNIFDALKIRCFFPSDPAHQRRIHSIGDLVILRNVKLISSSGRVAVVNSFSHFLLIPANKVPAAHFNDEFACGMKKLPHESTSRDRAPTAEEQMYVIALHQDWVTPGGTQVQAYGSSRALAQPAQPAQPVNPKPTQSGLAASAKGKFRLLSEVEENKFHDVVVEVVRKFPRFDKCEIYATDYTENPRFYDYGKERGESDGDAFSYLEGGQQNWKGPHGKRTIQIMLFEPHASHCIQKISEGDLVFIRNVRIKVDRNGWKWEGALHQDRKYTERVDIVKPHHSDERMTALEKRRDEYWKMFGSPHVAEAEPETKIPKKKNRKKRKAEEQARKEQEAEDSEPDANGPVGNTYVQTEKTQAAPTCLADIVDNAHYNFKTSTGVAYKLPFINAKFRAQVRVVDFFPHDLADFSRSLDDPAYDDVPLDTQSTDDYAIDLLSDSQPRWEWAFYILVEDAKQQPPSGTEDHPVRIPVLIAGLDAEYLLRLTAKDLRRDAKTLAQLKEKLFVLWGNLEELRSQSADFDPLADNTREKRQGQPFECLLKQYGVEVPYEEGDASLGYHRMFRMFGTTIK